MSPEARSTTSTSPGPPPGWTVTLDPRTRRSDAGRILVGGSPLRMLRLSSAGARMLDRWLDGEALPPGPPGATLARHLLDAGILHPRPTPDGRPFDPATDVAVVVPFRGPASELEATLVGLTDLLLGGAEPGTPEGASPAPIGEADPGSIDRPDPRRRDARGTDAGGTDPAGARPELELIVVDDGSPCAGAVAAAAAAAGARLLRHDSARGPGAARNTGWRATRRPVVCFLDSLVRPVTPPVVGTGGVGSARPGRAEGGGAPRSRRGWLEALLDHLGDASVAAVAPRVAARADHRTPEALAAYEAQDSPLDLGPDPAVVRPGGPVAYVPTAALVVRRDDLVALDGFDESLCHGEDVDLVWRLVGTGRTVRYEPSVVATHPTRPSFGAWVAQRVGYGASAAPLAARHGAAVAPLRISGWSAATWGLLACGHPLAGLAVAAGTTAALARRLDELDDPVREAVRLAGRGHLHAGAQIGRAVRRAWLPLALLAAVADRRARLPVTAAVLGPAVLDASRDRGSAPVPEGGSGVGRGSLADRARHAALRLVDDAAYCVGVWRGCLRARDPRALLPASSGPVRPPT